eukprot:3090568-Prymnesium_polylepis.1
MSTCHVSDLPKVRILARQQAYAPPHHYPIFAKGTFGKKSVKRETRMFGTPPGGGGAPRLRSRRRRDGPPARQTAAQARRTS